MRGDDVFGRRLSITYWRELTADEQEPTPNMRARRADAEIDALAAQLDDVPFEQPRKAA